MRQATQLEWLDRARGHLAAGTTDLGPGPTEVDVARYLDPAWLEAEERLLFRRLPVAVTFSARLRHPGDFVTHDLLGVPVLVLRDTSGGLRAFLNVCRHRGTRLVTEPGGCRRALTCPYHAWTYDLEGRLRGLPHENLFGGLDRSSHGLVPLPVGEAFGVVFVVTTPLEAPAGSAGEHPARLGEDLEAFLGPLREDMESFGLGGYVVHDERQLPLRANWKLIVEGALETYHVRHTHAGTIAGLFNDNVALAERFAPHLRLYFSKRSIASLAGQPLEGQSVRNHGNPLYHFFPNLTVLVQPDHATALMIFPRGVDGCVVQGAALIPEPAATEKAQRYWDKNVKIFWDALAEDFAIGESIQAGLASRANRHLTFGRFEQGCTWFNQALDEAIAIAR